MGAAFLKTFPLEGEGYAALATQSPRRSWMRGFPQTAEVALHRGYPHPASPKFAALIKASQPSPCTGEGLRGEAS